MAFPASGYLSTSARTTAEMKVAMESWLARTKQLMGGSAWPTLTISSNTITPTVGAHYVQPSGGGPTGTVNTAAVTNMEDGQLLILWPVSGKTITFAHQAGGTGQFSFASGASLVSSSTGVLFLLQNNTWKAVYFLHQTAAAFRAFWDLASATDFDAHDADTDNPHEVTQAQLAIPDRGVARWTTSTEAEWTVPTDVTKVFVSMISGGGGGGEAGYSTGGSGPGNAGSAGEASYLKRTTTTLVTAAGGAGGAPGNGGVGGQGSGRGAGNGQHKTDYSSTSYGGRCSLTAFNNYGRGGDGGDGSGAGGGASGEAGAFALAEEVAVTPGETLLVYPGAGGAGGTGGGSGEDGFQGVGGYVLITW